MAASGDVGNLLGPYEKWMFDIGKVFDLPDLMLQDSAHLSAVAEFSAPVAVQNLAGVSSSQQPGGAQYWIRLPRLYRNSAFKTRFLPFMISPVHDTASDARLLAQDATSVQGFAANFGPGLALPPGTSGRFRMNFPVRSEAVDDTLPQDPTPPAPDPALAGAPPKVILAIIDLGIPFAHANFRHPGSDATRIDYCWAQSAPAAGEGMVPFGREFTRAQIDDLVQTHQGDEEAIYRAAGLLSRPDGPPMPLSRATSHGAHCLDLMAGNWPATSAAQARIIAVDLPSSAIWETSGFGKDMFILSALHYIFDRADLIRQSYGCADLPLVINLSYGHSGGPHDGSGLIEAAMAELVDFRNTLAPTTLVLPSGNTFQSQLSAQLTGQHFSDDPDDPNGKLARLQWLAPPDDRTSSFLELWFPPGFAHENIRISVTAPNSDEIANTDGLPLDAAGFGARSLRIAGKVVGQLTVDRHRASRWRAMVLLAPTASFAPPAKLVVGADQYGTAPAGLWTLTFRMPKAVALPETLTVAGYPDPGGIRARIQRDTSYGQGNTGARQSHFVDPADLPYSAEGNLSRVDQPMAMLRRFGSLNGMATARSSIVAGGQIASSRLAAEYGSAGIASSANPPLGLGKQVELSAVTERSPLQPGMIGAGTRSSTTVAASGTSSASPQVARQFALSLIAAPLAAGASHDEVLDRLAATPGATTIIKAGTGPAGQLRLGRFVLPG